MMRAAQKRGHSVFFALQESLFWKRDVMAHATRISLTDNDEDWYRPHETVVEPLKAFGAVLMLRRRLG